MPNFIMPEIEVAGSPLDLMARNALAGYGGVQAIQNAQTRNALNQMQLEKERKGESALSEYAKSKDVQAAMNIDPKTGMAISDWLDKKSKSELDIIKDNIAVFDKKKAYYVRNPEAYAADYKTLLPDLQRAMPTPEQFSAMTPDEQQKTLFRAETVAAGIKHLTQGVKISGGHVVQPTETGYKITPLPEKPLTELEKLRIKNLQADLDNPTRKQRPHTPTIGELEQKGFNEYLTDPKVPASERNWLGYVKAKSKAQGEGKAGDTTRTDYRGRTTTTSKRPAGQGTSPPPAGEVNGTPIGKTPDGKIVYKGQDGTNFTVD